MLGAIGLCGFPLAGEGQDRSLPSFRLAATGPLAQVLEGEPPSCGSHDIPDAGMRAFRRFDGQIVAFASETESYPLIGPDLAHLHKRCRPAYQSARDEDPAHFNDQTWIAATWTENGRDVMAIGHQEYHGELHPGHCQGTTPRQCRYGVLLHLISHDGGMTFSKSTSKPLAAVPARQVYGQTRDTGFFQPSNIFEHDGWKYVFVRSSGGGDQPAATCLMRASDALNPDLWTIYDGAAFRPALFDPYHDEPARRPICAQISTLQGLVWSVVTDRESGLLIALVSLIEPSTRSAYLATATSRDALHWSATTPVDGLNLQWTAPCPKTPFVHYPSLMDASSSRRNFDDTGKDGLVMLSRIEIVDCKFTLTRDLVRMHFHMQE